MWRRYGSINLSIPYFIYGNLYDSQDVNIDKVEYDTEHIFLRSSAMGKPKNTTYTIDNITYKAIEVACQIYIPDNTKII